jgi:hypothetical protein
LYSFIAFVSFCSIAFPFFSFGCHEPIDSDQISAGLRMPIEERKKCDFILQAVEIDVLFVRPFPRSRRGERKVRKDGFPRFRAEKQEGAQETHQCRASATPAVDGVQESKRNRSFTLAARKSAGDTYETSEPRPSEVGSLTDSVVRRPLSEDTHFTTKVLISPKILMQHM